MATYSFSDCLQNAYEVDWRIGDVLGDGRFDPSARWLPSGLSAVGLTIPCLSHDELRRLNHIEMAAYAHLFGYFEEFVSPQVTELALDHQLGDRDAFDALMNFASEEVKHMMLFRKTRERIDEAVGIELELIGGPRETARLVLSKSTPAVLLLTACIEWLTQSHYLDAFHVDQSIDPLTKRIFKAHWREESQHAKLDHLETLRAFAAADDGERDRAIDELIELFAAVDGLLRGQTELDLRNFGRYVQRSFDAWQTEVLRQAILRAKRWTFIQSGVTHPRFRELLEAVATPEQRARVHAALNELFADPACVG